MSRTALPVCGPRVDAWGRACITEPRNRCPPRHLRRFQYPTNSSKLTQRELPHFFFFKSRKIRFLHVMHNPRPDSAI